MQKKCRGGNQLRTRFFSKNHKKSETWQNFILTQWTIVKWLYWAWKNRKKMLGFFFDEISAFLFFQLSKSDKNEQSLKNAAGFEFFGAFFGLVGPQGPRILVPVKPDSLNSSLKSENWKSSIRIQKLNVSAAFTVDKRLQKQVFFLQKYLKITSIYLKIPVFTWKYLLFQNWKNQKKIKQKIPENTPKCLVFTWKNTCFEAKTGIVLPENACFCTKNTRKYLKRVCLW